MKKFLLFVIIAVVTVYFSLGFIVKTQIESQVYYHTGVPLKVQFVSIKPFSGTASISGITIDNPDNFRGFSSAFSVSNIYADIELASLIQQPIHIKQLRITQPEVFIEMFAGQLNLAVLKKQLKQSAPESTKEPTPKDGNLKLVLSELIIERSSIHLATGVIPATLGKRYDIQTINLKDIGKSTNGADIPNITGLIIAEIQRRTDDIPRRILMSSVGDLSKELLTLPLEVLKGSPEALLRLPGTAADTIRNTPDNLIKGIKAAPQTLNKFLPFGSQKEE
jgi:hypothetical protein